MPSNLERWGRAKFTRSTPINTWAAKITANRSRYEAVSAKTGVPWDVIGVIHYREATCDFARVLHNGQKIIGTGKKTTIVPKGRGPFKSWEEAAIDALMNCSPFLAKHKDWSIVGPTRRGNLIIRTTEWEDGVAVNYEVKGKAPIY